MKKKLIGKGVHTASQAARDQMRRAEYGAMHIRQARHGDEVGIWKAHTRAMTEISSRDYSKEVIDELLSPEPVSNIEAVQGCRYYVAEVDEKIVGFGGINLKDGEIQTLIVDPDHIRQGIGTKLIEKLEEVAVGAGLARLTVGSSKYGRPFYAACGFSGESLRTVTGRRTGVTFQEYLMEKVL